MTEYQSDAPQDTSNLCTFIDKEVENQQLIAAMITKINKQIQQASDFRNEMKITDKEIKILYDSVNSFEKEIKKSIIIDNTIAQINKQAQQVSDLLNKLKLLYN